MRNFSMASADSVNAAAVSLTADLVHACAIRGGNVDTGVPNSISLPDIRGSPQSEYLATLRQTQIVVALIGSPVYFPALVRAMQVRGQA